MKFAFFNNEKTEKVNKEELEYLEFLKVFRANYPVEDGWEINVYKDKEGYVNCRLQKNQKTFSQASVERGEESHTSAERKAIIEALIRFGIVPDKTKETEESEAA
jgi:hypothetical protein